MGTRRGRCKMRASGAEGLHTCGGGTGGHATWTVLLPELPGLPVKKQTLPQGHGTQQALLGQLLGTLGQKQYQHTHHCWHS